MSQLAALRAARRKTDGRSSDGRSVGAVIREAVDAFVDAEPDRRQRAAQRLLAMNAPVEDWEVMKTQILKSRLGDW